MIKVAVDFERHYFCSPPFKEFYPANAYIIRQGAIGDKFFIISQGIVKVTQTIPGNYKFDNLLHCEGHLSKMSLNCKKIVVKIIIFFIF